MEQKMKCFDAAEINEIYLDLLSEAQQRLYNSELTELYFHGYFNAILEFKNELIKRMEENR